MGWDFGIIKEFFDFDKYRISHSLVITVIIITVVLVLCIFIFGFKDNGIGNWIKGLIVIFAGTFSLILWHDYQIKKEIEQENINQSVANLGRNDESERGLSPNFNISEPKLVAEQPIMQSFGGDKMQTQMQMQQQMQQQHQQQPQIQYQPQQTQYQYQEPNKNEQLLKEIQDRLSQI